MMTRGIGGIERRHILERLYRAREIAAAGVERRNRPAHHRVVGNRRSRGGERRFGLGNRPSILLKLRKLEVRSGTPRGLRNRTPHGCLPVRRLPCVDGLRIARRRLLKRQAGTVERRFRRRQREASRSVDAGGDDDGQHGGAKQDDSSGRYCTLLRNQLHAKKERPAPARARLRTSAGRADTCAWRWSAARSTGPPPLRARRRTRRW